MESEVVADVYGGENCDEVTTYFKTYCDGDKESDTHNDDIILELRTLPPGAKIKVEYPCCPSCGMPRMDKMEMLPGGHMNVIGHEEKCECGFDWENWVLEQYS